jgi:hypothetical protein
MPRLELAGHEPIYAAEMSEAYIGQIEYAGGATAHVDIDNLDAPDWEGSPRQILLNANAPDIWFVGVHLLEGPRAGQFATADLHRVAPAHFAGREPFGPAPPGVLARRLSGANDWVQAPAQRFELPRLLRVYPVAAPLDLSDGRLGVLCSVEVWEDRVILRTAWIQRGGVSAAPSGRLPLMIEDDVSTDYQRRSGGGGGGDFMTGYATFAPAPPPTAKHLYVTAFDVPLSPIDVPLDR